jgi:CHASE2 domain-containing sensor protein
VDRQKALIRTRERNVELLERAQPDAEAALVRATVDEERHALSRARNQLHFRHAAIAATTAIVLLVSLAGFFFGFQTLRPIFRPDSYVIAFNDMIGHHHTGPSVLLVAIDSATTAAYKVDRPDRQWRGRHAAVLAQLQRQGARAIAFNMSFSDYPEDSLRDVNDSLVREARAAHDAGIEVLIPIDSFVKDVPNVLPALKPWVRLGANCAEDVSRLTAKAVRTTIASAGAGKPARIHSVPLEAVAAFHGLSFRDRAPVREALPSLGPQLAPSAVVLDSVVAGDEQGCAMVQPGDTVYRTVVDYSSEDELQSANQRVSYLDVLRGAEVPQARNRLVLVGFENPETKASIVRGLRNEHRYLVDLERDAMNTLLRGTRIAPARPSLQFAVIVGMAALGALFAYLAGSLGRFGRLASAAGQAAAIVSVVLLYAALGAWLYATRHVLLNTAFDITSLALTFIAVTVVRRIWYP